ncbi:sulfurtransferase TusA family protein [Thermocladium modestius]|uniref:sulfurtransferase TusA family protein n=1 Tax=Thermocladium modestius TaxID=62609 RepID=UPI001E4579BD|nr:sulfurtransferase TusA family protein [Thermocladium modestius]
MDSLAQEYLIDVKGIECPQPVNVVAKELSKMPVGTQFRIVTDNYVCYMMLQRLLKMLGERVDSTAEHEDAEEYEIIATRLM